MAVRRRTDNGNWIVDFRVAGHRYRQTYPSHLGRREVAALERKRRAEIEAGSAGPSNSWASVAGRFWRDHARHLKWAPSVKAHLEALSDAIGDDTPVNRITTDTLAAAVARWREHLSPQTIKHRIATARAIWKRASEAWGIAMPAIAWQYLLLPIPDREPAYVPPAVRDAIMARAAPHVALAIRIALATGWRRSSVLGLRWEHVDWNRELVNGWGKGKALVAPLTDALRQILLEAAGPGGPAAAGPVVAWNGKAVGNTRMGFEAARRAAGFPNVLFRDLRPSVAQEVLAQTGSLDITGAVLAHSDPATTRRHYARVQLDAVRAALEARDRALSARRAS